MRFRMFSSQPSMIAIDFGMSSVKLLQAETSQKPRILAAAELPVPDELREDSAERLAFLEQELPKLLRVAGFKGRRVICAVPASQTILQHMQLAVPDGMKLSEAVKTELQISMGLSPESHVVRTHEVAELNREGAPRTEVICIAIPRDLIMRHIAMLEKLRLEVAGVHSQATALVHAFDHIHRRESDEKLTTLYIDLGWSGTVVVIAHGSDMTFARSVQVGGRHFDQLIAKMHKCDPAAARAHRLSLTDPHIASVGTKLEPAIDGLARLSAGFAAAQQPEDSSTKLEAGESCATTAEDRRRGHTAPAIAKSVEPGDAQARTANVDFSELLETINDELSMCLRYHRGLFPGRNFDRVILVGGEARQEWLCKHVAKALRLPARLGDPLARFGASDKVRETPGLDRTRPQPGWSTACGLWAASSES